MIERTIDVTTADGVMPTFVFHPEHGGPHPVVLFLMDARGVRPALRDMASRLASAGYYVLLPYLYYRSGPYREFPADEDMPLIQENMARVTPTVFVRDGAALLGLAEGDAAAADGPAAAVGYCLGGALALTLAKAFPGRVRAAASIHGSRLVRDTDESPHRGLDAMQGEAYFAWCKEDPTAPETHIPIVEEALTAAGVRYTIDVVDASHGFAPPGGRHYDRYTSELHWERVHALLRRNL